VVRAILEGVAYEMRLNLDGVRAGGIRVERMNAIGGGAKSDRWTQIKADITGVEMQAMNVSEAGCLGAAILAGSGAGILPPAAEAARRFAVPRKTFHPDPDRAKLYDKGYAIYRRIYESIKSINHDIARFAQET
jgi:xylulokinase